MGATHLNMAALLHTFLAYLWAILVPLYNAISRIRKAGKNENSSRGLVKAGTQSRKPSFPRFQELPTELVVFMMCHTRSCDLVNLIRTDKSTNEIFKHHKTSIFKRMQMCQFPEFSGWFGDLPGFDGSVLSFNRSSAQVQCLRDVVFTFDWGAEVAAPRDDTFNLRAEVAAPIDDKAAGVFLHLLESYGGWRYLYFLNAMKYHVEHEARNLYRISRMTIPSMNKGLAKAMVLCLARMSWRESIIAGEVEVLADMPARVENRLKSFQQEPRILQNLMRTTLRFLIYCIAKRLQLEDTVSFYRQIPTPVTVEAFDNLTSEIMTQLLLESIFYCGVGMAIQLCEEPGDYNLVTAQSWIQRRFELDLRRQLNAITLGINLEIDPCIQEGSLWAAGIGFPTFGWFRSDSEGPSVEDIKMSFAHVEAE